MSPTSRNAPCPCGSGRKAKDCCSSGKGAAAGPDAAADSPLLRGGLLAAFVAFLLCRLYFKIWDPDLWFHLSIGRYIVQHGLIPHANLFSWTDPAQPWVVHEWLSQVLFYGVYSRFSAGGVLLLRMTVFLAVFGVLLRSVRRPGWELLNIGGLAVAAHAAAMRFNDRPEMFSALFIAVQLLVLERRRRGEKAPLWVIPLIQALWANMHGYYLLGIALIVLYWAGTAWSEGLRRSRDLAVLAGAALLACLANPRFGACLLHTLRSARLSMEANIHEFAPTFSSWADFRETGWFEIEKLAVWLPALCLLSNRRRVPAAHWLVWAAFLGMYLRSQRNLLFIAVLAFPIALWNLREALEEWVGAHPSFAPRRLKPVLGVLLAGALLWSAQDFASGRFYRRGGYFLAPGTGFSSLHSPVGACDYVVDAGLQGPAFNNYVAGNYLLWRFPDRKVFIDGRGVEAYGRAFFSSYWDIAGGKVPLAAFTARYPVRYFLIDPFQDPGVVPLLRALGRDPAWKPAYIDHAGVVFVPSSDERPMTLRRPGGAGGSREPRQLVWEHYNLGSILLWLGKDALAQKEFSEVFRMEPDFST
ncbi:MAG: SEC-C domain-containing protein [Elusimicrobiota bacterium]